VNGCVVIFLAAGQYGGGKSWMIASSTAGPWSSGGVWEVEGTVVSRRVHGESDGRREVTGHGGALARPETSWRASMPILACAGRVWARRFWAVWSSTWVSKCMVMISIVRASYVTC
jgi:hypothetical protein